MRQRCMNGNAFLCELGSLCVPKRRSRACGVRLCIFESGTGALMTPGMVEAVTEKPELHPDHTTQQKTFSLFVWALF